MTEVTQDDRDLAMRLAGPFDIALQEVITGIVSAHRTTAEQRGYQRGVEDAAKACEELCFFTDINELMDMTKQEMSVRTCHEAAKAIRALGDKNHVE